MTPDKVFLDTLLLYYPDAIINYNETIEIKQHPRILFISFNSSIEYKKLEIIRSKLKELNVNALISIYDYIYDITFRFDREYDLIISKKTPIELLKKLDFREILSKTKFRYSVLIYDKFGNYDIVNVNSIMPFIYFKPDNIEFPKIINRKISNQKELIIVPTIYNNEPLNKEEIKIITIVTSVLNYSSYYDYEDKYFVTSVGDFIFTKPIKSKILYRITRAINKAIQDNKYSPNIDNFITVIQKDNLLILIKNSNERYVSNFVNEDDIKDFILNNYFVFARYNNRIIKIKSEEIGYNLFISKLSDNKYIAYNNYGAFVTNDKVIILHDNYKIIFKLKKHLSKSEIKELISLLEFDYDEIQISNNKIIIYDSIIIDPNELFPKTIHKTDNIISLYINQKYNINKKAKHILFTTYTNNMVIFNSIQKLLNLTEKVIIKKRHPH